MRETEARLSKDKFDTAIRQIASYKYTTGRLSYSVVLTVDSRAFETDAGAAEASLQIGKEIAATILARVRSSKKPCPSM